METWQKSLIIIAVAIAALLGLAQFVSQPSVFPATGAGIITAPACGTNLNLSDTTYVMNQSYLGVSGNCYLITASNVTLDCAGFSITSDGSGDYGIFTSFDNSTIKNCPVVTDFATAPVEIDGSDALIQNSSPFTLYINAANNVSVINCTTGHIDITDSSYIYITNTTANFTSAEGMLVTTSNHLIITNSNFYSATNGITLTTVTYSNFTNVIAKTEAAAGSRNGLGLASSSNNTFVNITAFGYGATGKGIDLSASHDNTFDICSATLLTGNGYGMRVTGSTRNSFNRCTAYSANDRGVSFETASHLNRFTNGQIFGKSATYGALSSRAGSQNLYIANNTINGLGGTYAMSFITGANLNSTIVGNIFTNATTGVYIAASSANHTFYWNNFTGLTFYVNDTDGRNFYNSTEGNKWENVVNGSVNITGTNASALPGFNIGVEGSGYPYNNSTSQGKVFGNVVDYAPLVEQPASPFSCGDLNASYDLAANLTSVGSCLNITADNVVLDCKGFSIVGDNSTNSAGVYSNHTNTTVKNCVIQNFSRGIYYSGASNSLALNNTVLVNYAAGRGIMLDNSGNAINLSANTISCNSGAYGVYSVSHNLTLDCQGAIVSGNRTFNATSYGFLLYGINDTIEGCNVQNFTVGIYIGNGVSGLVMHNTSTYSNMSGAIGLSLSGSSYNTIQNSSFTTYGEGADNYGVYVFNSNYNRFINITAFSGAQQKYGIGMMLYSSSQYNTVSNSNLTGFSLGFLMSGAPRNNVTNTYMASTNTNASHPTAMNFGCGNHHSDSFDNYYYNNTCYSPVGAGLYDWAAYTGDNPHDNVFDSNLFQGKGTGIVLEVIGDDRFYNNTIENWGSATWTNAAVGINNNIGGVVLENNTILAHGTQGSAITLWAETGITIKGNRIYNNASSPAIQFAYLANNNVVRDNYIFSNNSDAIWFKPLEMTWANNNTIFNNTLVLGTNNTNYVYICANCSNTVFYWNNLSSTTSGYYVTDANGTNSMGASEGNLYPNILNGSVNITGVVPSAGYPAFKVGSAGANYPYNYSNSFGKMINATDYHPLTNQNGTGAVDGQNFTVAFVIPRNGTLVYSLNFERAPCNITAPVAATVGTSTFAARVAPNGLVFNEIGSGDYFEQNVKNYFGGIPALPDIRNRTFGIDLMLNCTGSQLVNATTNVSYWSGANCAGQTAQFTVNTTIKMKALYSGWNSSVCANSLQLTYAGIYGGYIGAINITTS